MAKNVILTKEQEQKLISILNEEAYSMPVPKKTNKPYCINPEKVLIVKNYLDKGFQRGSYEEIGPNGFPMKRRVVGMLASNGEMLKTLPEEEFLSLLIEKFKNMFSDKDERTLFLKQVMNDWFNDKITVFGGLSVNHL